jgi:hypothetical protein
LNPFMNPGLESAWFQQPSNLKCDILVSKFAALSNASTCTATPGEAPERSLGAAMDPPPAGLHKLNPV